MKCKFPDYAAGTAYNRGCRCERCRTNKRELAKRCAAKPWEERTPSIRAKYPVPAGPILRVLESWLEEVGSQTDIAYEVLAQELGLNNAETAGRMVVRFRNKETTYVSFSTADNIVSKLYGPHFWLLDDELNAIYEEHA